MVDAIQLEEDRAKNLMRSFSWDFVSSLRESDHVTVSFQRGMQGQAQNQKMFELERIGNLGKTQGWSVKTSSIEGDLIKVTLDRIVKQEK